MLYKVYKDEGKNNSSKLPTFSFAIWPVKLKCINDEECLRVWIAEVPIFNQSCFSSVVASQITVSVETISEHCIAPEVQRLKDTYVRNNS